jgi:glutamate-ammonia-ligase adenylyltransferase
MALTRARVVAGEERLSHEIGTTISNILCRERDGETIKRDARAMRALIAREKGDEDPWDLKLVAGGLLDIEFIVQYLALRYAAHYPGILGGDAMAIIESAFTAHLIPMGQVEYLRSAHELFTTVTQITRIAIDGPFRPSTVALGVLRRLATATGLPDFRALEATLRDQQRRVREIFNAIFN